MDKKTFLIYINTPWYRSRITFVLLIAWFGVFVLSCLRVEAGELTLSERSGYAWKAEDTPLKLETKHRNSWFVLPALINVYPKLESENLIRKYYNPAMRVLAPGFNDVRTVGALRDEHLLWTPDLSVGRVLSPHLAVYVHFGYSGGKVRTKRKDTSLILLPLRTDFEIFRSAAYVGLCADVFPWGMPERRKYDGIGDRLKNTRPCIGFRLTETYASYRVKVKNGFIPGVHVLNLELSDNWWVPSFNVNLGADIPIDAHNALTVNGGYNFSFSKDHDFDGAAFTVAWKRYLN